MSFGNVPVDLNDPVIVQMVDVCQLQFQMNPLGMNDNVPLKNQRPGMDRLHMQTLQSMLYMGHGADSLLRTEDVETRDLSLYMYGKDSLTVVCVMLKDAGIESMF